MQGLFTTPKDTYFRWEGKFAGSATFLVNSTEKYVLLAFNGNGAEEGEDVTQQLSTQFTYSVTIYGAQAEGKAVFLAELSFPTAFER